MNPIPPISTIPIEGLGTPLQGLPLEVLGFLSIAVIAACAAVLWMVRHADQVRERLRCPLRLRRATVTFRVAEDGTRTDVVRCSLLRGRREMLCDKVCLRKAAVA